MTIVELNENDRRSFLELTENSAIREAAYPLSEWEQNGGSKFGGGLLGGLNNGYSVPNQDDPPEVIKNQHLGLLLATKQINIKQDPASRANNIAAHWQKVEAHACYKWLLSHANFKSAQVKFKKQQKLADKSSKLNSEFADFRFARAVVMVVLFQLFREKAGYQPAYADAKLLTKTKGYVSKLRESIKEGARLSDWQEQRNLDRLLEQLQLEINVAPRKEKVTATSEKRKCLETVAYLMKLDLELLSVTILSDLAAMLNWQADDATIGGVVKITEEKYQSYQDELRKALAKALREIPVQKS